jgi:hypothetical protein
MIEILVSIPNPEVKPAGADGTARAAEWKSMSLAGFSIRRQGILQEFPVRPMEEVPRDGDESRIKGRSTGSINPSIILLSSISVVWGGPRGFGCWTRVFYIGEVYEHIHRKHFQDLHLICSCSMYHP